MAKATKKVIPAITSSKAVTDDGSVQITFSIPETLIKNEEEHALAHLAADIEVPGFRKGKAPLSKAREKISPEKLLEHTLGHILPQAFTEAIAEHKVTPITYPRFEVLSQGEVWQIRATTAQLPEFDLGDYKKVVSEALNDKKIWTPGDDKEAREPSPEEKEQKALQVLLDYIKLDVPKMLIEEEVNHRLAQLLERIEKLGLKLESYLASVGKTVEGLREEYEAQSKSAISLELILNKIAEVEKITVPEDQIEQALKATSADPNVAKKAADPEQRRIVQSILRRRAVLDSLIGSKVSLG